LDIKTFKEKASVKVEEQKQEPVVGPKTPEEPEQPKGPGYGITFVMGDNVTYNDDSISSRVWTITRLEGVHATIETNDSIEVKPRFGNLNYEGTTLIVNVNIEELQLYKAPFEGSPVPFEGSPVNMPTQAHPPMSPGYEPDPRTPPPNTYGPRTPPPMSPGYVPGPRTPPPMSPGYVPGPRTPPSPGHTPAPPGFVRTPVSPSPSPTPIPLGISELPAYVRTPSPSYYGPGATFREGSPDYGPNTTYFDERKARFEEANVPYPPLGSGANIPEKIETEVQEEPSKDVSILEIEEEPKKDDDEKEKDDTVKKKITLDI